MRITGGEFRGRNLAVPKGDHVRPTSDRTRQAIFNVLQGGRIDIDLIDCYVLDVFCGTGALGLEAISRGAAGCIFVDRDKNSIAMTRQNCASLGLTNNIQFIMKDATQIGLKGPSVPAANLVFVDPPYRKGLVPPTLLALVENGWLAPSAICVLETETKGPEDDLRDLPFACHDTRPYGDTLIRIVQYAG